MDAIDKKILAALNDRKFKARTINGVAKSVNVDSKSVLARIDSSPELKCEVKVYPRRSKDGRVLITTKSNFSRTASVKDKFIDAFATKRVSIKDGF